MKVNFHKAHMAIHYGFKLPRKTKKFLLGKRMSKAELSRLLKSVEIIEPADTMYDRPIIKPYEFCPKCGTIGYVGTGNKTGYPEHWEYFHCVRCRSVVGYIDNSAFIHALECKEDNYNPIF